MKRIFLLLFFILLSGSAAFAGPVVTVVNNTGYPISYLYISTNNTDDWEEDVLGRQVLGNGETVRVT